MAKLSEAFNFKENVPVDYDSIIEKNVQNLLNIKFLLIFVSFKDLLEYEKF